MYIAVYCSGWQKELQDFSDRNFSSVDSYSPTQFFLSLFEPEGFLLCTDLNQMPRWRGYHSWHCVPEVTGYYNLGLEASYPDWCFLWFSSVSQCLKWTMTASLNVLPALLFIIILKLYSAPVPKHHATGV